MHAGFIGLGRMGRPMSLHTLRAGIGVTVFDLKADAIRALAEHGAQIAESPRQVAAQSDVMIVMVENDAQVKEVVAGKNGLLEGARAGAVIAVSSSTHPRTCRALAQIAQARGVGLVDAPVALGARAAEAGTLTVFAGGARADVDQCRPIMNAFAKNIFYMGPVGNGQITKTCNNLLLWSGIVACYETLTLGARLGIHANALRPALSAGSADSWVLNQLDRVGLYWPHKDMEIALEMAKECELPMPLMRQVQDDILNLSAEKLQKLFA
ncbi:MAG: NAD(P)-dependent oxidoreductase [Chloroflexi bacterium]|nr:NAD(P)-dependent oxidoreductase [Chloroflexota bacterium]MBI3756336.1 NAD(P)-dependent oxidoreductase [Deltaproteobacteria bacterium]